MRNRLTEASLHLRHAHCGAAVLEVMMGKALILWLLGVPGIIVILLYFFVFR
jgi:hypothetical protein